MVGCSTPLRTGRGLILAFMVILISTSARAATHFVKSDATGANNGTS